MGLAAFVNQFLQPAGSMPAISTSSAILRMIVFVDAVGDVDEESSSIPMPRRGQPGPSPRRVCEWDLTEPDPVFAAVLPIGLILCQLQAYVASFMMRARSAGVRCGRQNRLRIAVAERFKLAQPSRQHGSYAIEGNSA